MARKKDIEMIRYSEAKKRNGNGDHYIHYNYSNSGVPDLYERFSQEKTRAVYNNQITKLKRSVKKNYSGVLDEVEDIFKFLDTIKENLSPEIIEKEIMSTVKTSGTKVKRNIFNPELGQYIKEDSNKSIASMSFFAKSSGVGNNQLVEDRLGLLNDYIETVDEILEDVEVHFNDKAIQEFVNNFIVMTGDKPDTTSSTFRDAYDAFIKSVEGKDMTFSVRKAGEKVDTFVKYAERAKVYLEMMKRLQAKENLTNNEERFVKGLSKYIATLINQIGGFMYETVLKDTVNMANSAVLSSLQAATSGSKKIEITNLPKKTIADLKTKKVVSKSDLRLTYDFNGSDIESVITLDIPGATVKAFSPSGGLDEFSDVHIQTGTTLKDLLLRSKIYDKAETYAMFNMLASYRSGKKGLTIPMKEMDLMHKYIAAKNILNSLSGVLTKEDTAYFVVLNEKVFTAPEIIRELGKANSSLFRMDRMELTPTQTAIAKANNFIDRPAAESEEEAEERSNIMLDLLINAHVNTSLMVANRIFID